MLSTTKLVCGIDHALPAERSDMQPFQGWGTGTPPTQGGASLTLGFKIEPPWGSRSKPCRNAETNGRTHINGHAGDAGVVSTVCSDGNDIAFVERLEVVEWAPLMAEPLCAGEDEDRRDRTMIMRRTHRPAGSGPKRQRRFILKPRVSEAPPWVKRPPRPQP